MEKGRFVLMDYRCDHLRDDQRSEPPTFLYAMDLGDGVFFVEETSLASQGGFLNEEHTIAKIHRIEKCGGFTALVIPQVIAAVVHQDEASLLHWVPGKTTDHSIGGRLWSGRSFFQEPSGEGTLRPDGLPLRSPAG